MTSTLTSDRVLNVSYTSNFESKYQQGLEMTYEVDGKKRVGEFNVKMGSVAILLYHRTSKSFLLVRQFRPAIFTATIVNMDENYGKELNEINWEKYNPELGYTVELCAGLIDKEGLSPEEIACEEVAEECGYKVTRSQLITISSFVVGAHQSGNAQYMFYAEIDESMKISEGGGNVNEGEVIDKVHLSLDSARSLIYPNENTVSDIKGPPGVLLALQWWFSREKSDKKSITTTDFVWKAKNVRSVTNVSFCKEFDKKKYGYNPKRMSFTLGKVTRTWDLALAPSTATCILIDTESREFILLQMLRVPVLIGRTRFLAENKGKRLENIEFEKSDPSWAYTLELPVCYVPNHGNHQQLVKERVKELGFDFENDQLKNIAKVIPGIGQSGDTQHIYFADVKYSKNCDRKENEDLEEVRIKFDDLSTLFNQQLIGPPNVYFAIGYIIDKLSL